MITEQPYCKTRNQSNKVLPAFRIIFCMVLYLTTENNSAPVLTCGFASLHQTLWFLLIGVIQPQLQLWHDARTLLPQRPLPWRPGRADVCSR